VTAAHKQGLATMIIRFGNLGWHSVTEIGNYLDYQGMLLSGCWRLSARPLIEGWKFEVTPVDFAASALVALAAMTNFSLTVLYSIECKMVLPGQNKSLNG
jgi:thioester reductase-like protein